MNSAAPPQKVSGASAIERISPREAINILGMSAARKKYLKMLKGYRRRTAVTFANIREKAISLLTLFDLCHEKMRSARPEESIKESISSSTLSEIAK